ncbi:hypothetical protein [Anaerocolumna sp. MB42-C2]|uniref:hypothetical protein n=1 Tax=Anaerocolumna sp. MB42-C2 TaxID=3070997 RepID=UPI0027E06E6D|nr:hypothetical protein [Anaerocolumna sp. MB42-C2]WMJ85481.1 hypothetical protein RBU59_15530 [Anaerocolumna sp. MB42-C2]
MDNYYNYWNNPSYYRDNVMLRISNYDRRMVGPDQFLPLTGSLLDIPNNNNNGYRINPDYLQFEPGIYCISYNVTARIPVAAPTTIPLIIYESHGGRPGMRFYASAYNIDNTATVSGTTLIRGIGFDGRGTSFELRNLTRDLNGQASSIELVMLEIAAFKILDI